MIESTTPFQQRMIHQKNKSKKNTKKILYIDHLIIENTSNKDHPRETKNPCIGFIVRTKHSYHGTCVVFLSVVDNNR